MQDDLLNKENSCENDIEFKHENKSVLNTIETSDSCFTTYNENCNTINDKIFPNDINVGVADNLLEFKFKNIDKNNSALKINNILNTNTISARESNIFISEIIQNRDCESNIEHLNLTIKDTSNSAILKFQETNQEIISQDHINDDKEEIDQVLTAENDSDDILYLYDEKDIHFDENIAENVKANVSEFAPKILEGTSKTNEIVFQTNPDHENETSTYIDNVVKKKNDFIFNEKIHPVHMNHPLDDKNCKSLILDVISNNDCSENKNNFDYKLDESFVSEYEISLLEEDTDSILSVESFDSEYEISLLEDDINDEENQNDLHENKSNHNVDSNNLCKGDDRNEKNTDNVNLYENKVYEVIFKNKVDSKSVIETITSEERFPSQCHKDKQVDKMYSDVKIPAQDKKIQRFNKTKSTENINEKTEQDFKNITDDKIILKSEKPTIFRPEKSADIKKELSENSNDNHHLLKLKINNESQILNKVELNSNKLKNPEDKTVVVNTNRHLVSNSHTDKTTIEKFTKTHRDIPDIDESKQNRNGKFQPLLKKAFDSKINENKNSEENILIANTHKQLTENTSNNKATGEKTVKDSSVSASDESKQDVKDIIPDYFEEEKEDLINPGWNKIKELSTDEERYRQVKDCWKSKTIPNPFKNLTYYSYRNHKINCRENNTQQTRQHKRHASNNLNDKNAKRSRSCTYIFDDRINSIEKEREIKAKSLHDKMLNEVSRLNEQHYHEEMGVQNFYGYSFDPRRQFKLHSLERNYQERVSSVTVEYERRVNDCCDQYASEINKLKNNRNEVLQFYSFYKGLNKNEYKDPTILTNAQMQELEEIENIYNQMDLHYR